MAAATRSDVQQQELKFFCSETDQPCAKPISTIFFDLDNTLIPTRRGDAKACGKIADLLYKEHGLPRDQAIEATTTFLAAYRRCPDNPAMPLAQWRTHQWEDVLPSGYKHLAPELYPRWSDLRIRYLAPSAEILSMLVSLRQHFLLGIITNGPSASQWEKVDRLGLGRYFDCILVSSDLPWAKPDRNIFAAACHYLGVQPEECAMIGDKLETDVQGGVESNMGATIWLPLPKDLHLSHDRTLADVDDHVRPDYIVEDVLDLPALLPQIQEQEQHEPLANFRQMENGRTKTTRNRAASYNRFLQAEAPDLHCCSSSSCDSTGSV